MATVRYDRNLCRIYASQAYLQIVVSERAAEILGKSIDELWWPTNISAKNYRVLLEEVMMTGKESEITLEWTDGDGLPVSFIEKLLPEYDDAGEVAGVSVLVLDISQLRRQQIVEGKRQRVFERLAYGDDLSDVLTELALYVESVKPGAYCCILVLDERKNYLHTVVAPSVPDSFRTRLESAVFMDEIGRCNGWADSMAGAEWTVISDFCHHDCQHCCSQSLLEKGVLACWSEPILSSSAQLQGVLCLYLKEAGVPGNEDLALLHQASRLGGLVIERKRFEQQIYVQACYDPLTDLPNRRLFRKRLHEEIVKAERGASRFALLFIDLDRFKEVNDTLGHQAGDGVLVEAAHRIQSCVRETDTVARLGGDEFVIILPELGDNSPFERVAQNLVSLMQKPFIVGDRHASVSASIGISIFPTDGTDAESLIRSADKTMYLAKQAGRNTYRTSYCCLSEREQRRLQLSHDLCEALNKGQFEVHFQPIMDTAGKQVVKAEALLRWHHPEFGSVALNQFIPIAEKTDMILEIGNWVFREAVDMAKRWNTMLGGRDFKQISINMSACQLSVDCAEIYPIDYLASVGLSPSSIALEISESLLLQDFAKLAEKLQSVRALGIQLSLDNFGAGVSAIANLKKVSIDYLKIDGSYIRDLETDIGRREMLETIVLMAQRLGLKVIAEGVETVGQADLLAGMGCDYQQGFLYSRPLPGDAFLAFAQSSNGNGEVFPTKLP